MILNLIIPNLINNSSGKSFREKSAPSLVQPHCIPPSEGYLYTIFPLIKANSQLHIELPTLRRAA